MTGSDEVILVGSNTSDELYHTLWNGDSFEDDPPVLLGNDISVRDKMPFDLAESGVFAGLVGWWKLDDASGSTAADSSATGYDGTLQNMAGDEWGAGHVGGALEFDGINDFVRMPDSATALQLTGDYSSSLWILADSAQKQWAGIYSRCTTSGNDNHFTLQFNNAADRRLTVYHPSGKRWITSCTLADVAGAWHHIAVAYRYSPARVQLYVDGSFHSESTSLTQKPGSGNGKLHIGGERTGSSSYVFKGKIDDLRIYDRVLSAEEIAVLAASG